MLATHKSNKEGTELSSQGEAQLHFCSASVVCHHHCYAAPSAIPRCHSLPASSTSRLSAWNSSSVNVATSAEVCRSHWLVFQTPLFMLFRLVAHIIQQLSVTALGVPPPHTQQQPAQGQLQPFSTWKSSEQPAKPAFLPWRTHRDGIARRDHIHPTFTTDSALPKGLLWLQSRGSQVCIPMLQLLEDPPQQLGLC